MKALKSYLILFLMVVLVSSAISCSFFRNPLGAWTSATTKVETIEQKVQNNKNGAIGQVRQYIHATDLTLRSDPMPNKYNFLAQDFTTKASITLGLPTMEETIILRKMVSDLLSTNQQIVDRGQKQLSKLDNQVIELQQENVNLQTSLTQAQAKLGTLGTANATLAQRWATLTKWFWGIVYGFIIIVVIRVISIFLPPPYNSVAMVVSLPFTFLFQVINKMIPEAKRASGLVSDEYKSATEQLLKAVQTIKDSHPEIHTEISETVNNSVDSTIVPVINKAKADIKLVS